MFVLVSVVLLRLITGRTGWKLEYGFSPTRLAILNVGLTVGVWLTPPLAH